MRVCDKCGTELVRQHLIESKLKGLFNPIASRFPQPTDLCSGCLKKFGELVIKWLGKSNKTQS